MASTEWWCRMVVMHGDRRRVRPVKSDSAADPAAADEDPSYPSSTDGWCWHCCHPFRTRPLPMPIKYDDRRDVFHVMGTFCSWACMKAYNLDSTSYMKHVNANTITLFRKRCTGCLGGLRPAPPRVALKVFGGTMSIEEFRAACEKPAGYSVLPPRMIVHRHAVLEKETSAQEQLRKRPTPAPDLNACVNFRDVSTKNETLRLKRPKPLQNNRNLLEKTMGLGTVANTL